MSALVLLLVIAAGLGLRWWFDRRAYWRGRGLERVSLVTPPPPPNPPVDASKWRAPAAGSMALRITEPITLPLVQRALLSVGLRLSGSRCAKWSAHERKVAAEWALSVRAVADGDKSLVIPSQPRCVAALGVGQYGPGRKARIGGAS